MMVVNMMIGMRNADKMKEESLSDKKIRCVCGGDNENRRILYHEKDVKEAVRKLRDICCECIKTEQHYEECMFCIQINKIFGDELI